MSTLHANTVETSSGGPVTLTQQTAARIWFGVPDETGHTIAQSLNISGSTDGGTGNWTYAVTNNAASQIDDYGLTGSVGWADGNGFRVRSNNTTSSQIHVATFNSSAAAHDCPKYINWCGDLA
jgi:hypothetical protein